MIHCALDSLPAHFIIPSDLSSLMSEFQILSTLPPIPLSGVTSSTIYFCDWRGKKRDLLLLADQFLENITYFLWLKFKFSMGTKHPHKLQAKSHTFLSLEVKAINSSTQNVNAKQNFHNLVLATDSISVTTGQKWVK